MKRTIATESGAFFPQRPVLLHQEPQGHQACRHVVVPPAPCPHLVVVEANLALGVLERLLDQVPSRRCPHHLIQRRVQWSVGEKEPAVGAPERTVGTAPA